jgi:type VI secretion system protein ImpF
MPKQTQEVRITLSVLDRLVDYEPDISREPPASREKSMRILKQAVRRDLEWLLNSREPLLDIPPDLEELNQSIAAYGLPDFSSMTVKNTADQSQMRRLIEEKLRIFEPRLIDPVVSMEPPRDLDRAVRFRINARLRVDPAPEPVTFDTTLNLYSGQYEVRGE